MADSLHLLVATCYSSWLCRIVLLVLCSIDLQFYQNAYLLVIDLLVVYIRSMEIPPYRLPTLRGVAFHTWERVWQYVKKAGTVILAVSILMMTLGSDRMAAGGPEAMVTP